MIATFIACGIFGAIWGLTLGLVLCVLAPLLVTFIAELLHHVSVSSTWAENEFWVVGTWLYFMGVGLFVSCHFVGKVAGAKMVNDKLIYERNASPEGIAGKIGFSISYIAFGLLAGCAFMAFLSFVSEIR